ncbi:unnamed protein product [Diamesa tonsa]
MGSRVNDPPVDVNGDLSAYVDQLEQQIRNQSNEKPNYNFENFADINKYWDVEIVKVIKQFPKEWTVVQLCKNFNAMAMSSKYEEIVSYNTGISMTLFKHSSLPDLQPLMDIVNLLKMFFGPWISLLTGNFKSLKSIEMENDIRKKVSEFLKKKNYTDHQEKLIQLLARRTDLLTHEQIFVAITYILTYKEKTTLGYDNINLNDLYDHLTWIKQEYIYEDTSSHPVILIVDETLDQLPFEMMNLQQEFTRMCSFDNLKKMYARYASEIENGYLICKSEKSQVLINPDGTLSSMETRMTSFFNYWLPNWNVSYNQQPTKEEYYDLLTKSDIFTYCGHGSGMQFAFTDEIHNLKSRAIVFLFGCSSVGLQSSGLCSELKGAHNLYHLGGSPVCIGFLWTVTDFHTDFCSSKIFSSWIKASHSKVHWHNLDKSIWKSTGQLSFTKNGDIFSSDSLSEVITKMHSDPDLPITLKTALVYRGIPVIHT